jgi:hypothetical protein
MLNAAGTQPTLPTWQFNWDVTGHLQTIADSSNGTHRTLYYSGAETIKSPFASDAASYGTTKRLTEVMTTTKRYRFEYGNRGAGTTTGELTKYILPYGGALRWDLRDFTYAGSRTAREIWVRYLQATPGGAETRHIWWRDDASDATRAHHAVASVWQDTPAGEPAAGDRVWWFDNGGKLATFQERAPGALVRRQTDYVWTWIDAANQRHPYVQQTTVRRMKAERA